MILIIIGVILLISSSILVYFYFYKEEPQQLEWKTLKPDTTIRCINGKLGDLENPYALYRYLGDGKVSYYPSPEIAFSHDKDWGNAIPVQDCTGITRMEDSTFKEGFKSYKLSGCEAEEANLICDTGVINSTKIKYGRWDNTICGHPTVNVGTPPVSKEYILLEAIGRTNYSIKDKNTLKNIDEDIYPNVFKHWEIDYSCG